MAQARRKLRDVVRVARDVRGLTPWQLWLGLAPVSLVALIDGDYALAAELLEREAAHGPMTTIRDDVSAWRMQSFLLARERATLAEMEADVRAAVDEFPWYPCHRAALALLLIDLGRDDEARVVFDDLARDEFSALYRDNEWLLGMKSSSTETDSTRRGYGNCHADRRRQGHPALRAGRGGRSRLAGGLRRSRAIPNPLGILRRESPPPLTQFRRLPVLRHAQIWAIPGPDSFYRGPGSHLGKRQRLAAQP